ncbi:MAG: hypothetical protein LLG06_13850 [Desulfobacteraceae bacterium]|nr:hypothetical protein [Desulfobacteraceae bacterium]
MIRAYVGFDDTDNIDADRGTGKLARWFEKRLPEGCGVWGVVRQQLLVHESIPYTSHNSSACVVVEMPDSSALADIVSRAASHLEEFALEGSDPGLCVACENDPGLPELMDFGRKCTSRVLTQKDAMEAARGIHLSGHGGTRDGIIGAAAAVGLTASGWSGRFIEYRNLRRFPDALKVSELQNAGITVVSLDRDGQCPAPEELVRTKGWLRPRLWGGRPVLPVMPEGTGVWESPGGKRGKKKAEDCLTGSGA